MCYQISSKNIEGLESVSAKVSEIEDFEEECQSFKIDNNDPGKTKKLMPFTEIGKKMITVGLIDIRKRIIPIKRLVSIYELLYELEFKYTLSVEYWEIDEVDYSPELDVLMLDSSVKMYYRPDRLERLYSVIQNGIEEVAGQWKQGHLGELEDDSIQEVQKLRFKVWGILKSRKNRIEVEILGYRGSQGFKKGEGMVACYDVGPSKIKFSVFSHGSEVDQAAANALKQNELERRSQKVVTKSSEVQRTDIEIEKNDLYHSRGIFVDEIDSARMVNKENLLVKSSRDLLLFDIRSKELISTLRYCQNIPDYFEETKIFGSIMASLKFTLSKIEIFQISKSARPADPLHLSSN